MALNKYPYFDTVFHDAGDVAFLKSPDSFHTSAVRNLNKNESKQQTEDIKERPKRFRSRLSQQFPSPPHKKKYCESPMAVNISQDTFFLSTPMKPRPVVKRTFWRKKKPRDSCFIVRSREMKMFFKLTAEDDVIRRFLEYDSCNRVADRYLLAMVFAYFKRADLSLWEYTRFNFFIALYLANDVEEDEEEMKYEIFPWALGRKWKEKFPYFLKKRDKLLRKIDYKAIVSRRCSDEIIAIEPDHSLWKRERPAHHAGALRAYMRDPEDDGFPRGPDLSPRYCQQCDARDSQYDSASPASVSWCVSSADSTPDRDGDGAYAATTAAANAATMARFDMKGLQRTLPTNDEIFPGTEE